MQMEEEHDERQKMVREKRELERRLQTLSEQQPARDRGPGVLPLVFIRVSVMLLLT